MLTLVRSRAAETLARSPVQPGTAGPAGSPPVARGPQLPAPVRLVGHLQHEVRARRVTGDRVDDPDALRCPAGAEGQVAVVDPHDHPVAVHDRDPDHVSRAAGVAAGVPEGGGVGPGGRRGEHDRDDGDENGEQDGGAAGAGVPDHSGVPSRPGSRAGATMLSRSVTKSQAVQLQRRQGIDRGGVAGPPACATVGDSRASRGSGWVASARSASRSVACRPAWASRVAAEASTTRGDPASAPARRPPGRWGPAPPPGPARWRPATVRRASCVGEVRPDVAASRIRLAPESSTNGLAQLPAAVRMCADGAGCLRVAPRPDQRVDCSWIARPVRRSR